MVGASVRSDGLGQHGSGEHQQRELADQPAARLEARSRTAYLDQRLSPSALDSFHFLNGTPARQEDADSEISQEIRLG